MAARVYETQITVPAGTPVATPVIQSWVTEDNVINTIELLIPPGHNGLTGIHVSKGDVQLLPYNGVSWIIANDYHNSFQVNDYIPTGDLKIQAYNTGQYAHTFYLRMTVTDRPVVSQASTVPQPADLGTGEFAATQDPLSPAAILGPDVANALTTGDLTANDVAPLQPTPLNIPPEPQPTGL